MGIYLPFQKSVAFIVLHQFLVDELICWWWKSLPEKSCLGLRPITLFSREMAYHSRNLVDTQRLLVEANCNTIEYKWRGCDRNSSECSPSECRSEGQNTSLCSWKTESWYFHQSGSAGSESERRKLVKLSSYLKWYLLMVACMVAMHEYQLRHMHRCRVWH